MDSKRDILRGIVFLIILPCLCFTFALGKKYSLEEAKRVLKIIEEIQGDESKEKRDFLKNATVSEEEFNSYIAYRIETEKEEMLKELRLKILEGNKIEGKIVIDLGKENIPPFLQHELNFFFAASLQVKEGKVRLNLNKLFLNGQAVQPLFIDMVLSFSAKINQAEPTSINDWYELPYGIKDIKTLKGKAIFYY